MHLNCGYLKLSAALFTCDEPDWMQILLFLPYVVPFFICKEKKEQ